MKITKARLKQMIREEMSKGDHPGVGKLDNLDTLVRKAVAGGKMGMDDKMAKKEFIRAVKEELEKEKELGIKEDLQNEILGTYFANRAMKKIKSRDLDDDGDGEGKMADSQLNRIADLATMIDEMVDDNTNLPEWVESKITKAQDYMSAVMNYMKGKKADAKEEMIDEEI